MTVTLPYGFFLSSTVSRFEMSFIVVLRQRHLKIPPEPIPSQANWQIRPCRGYRPVRRVRLGVADRVCFTHRGRDRRPEARREIIASTRHFHNRPATENRHLIVIFKIGDGSTEKSPRSRCSASWKNDILLGRCPPTHRF